MHTFTFHANSQSRHSIFRVFLVLIVTILFYSCTEDSKKSESERCTQDKCEDWCGDFKSDKDHCGNCENKCGGDEKCSNGKCIKATECASGEIKCFCNNQDGGTCTASEMEKFDVQCINSKASQTCGATDCEHLGKTCKPGQTCILGECRCPDDLVWNEATGECLTPQSESSCGVTAATAAAGTILHCGNHEYCDGTQCLCKSGFARKDENSECINILSDNNHCGGIDIKCPEHSECIDGECTCEHGFAMRKGDCVKPEYSDCCGFLDVRSNQPKYECNDLERCVSDGDNYKCECKHKIGDKCLDILNDDSYCGESFNEIQDCTSIVQQHGGATCQQGKCVCDNGSVVKMKNGVKTCVNINIDSECCGVDCERCSGFCFNGNCVSNCPSEALQCNGQCLDKELYHVEEDASNPGHCKCRIDIKNNHNMCPDVNNDPNYGCAVAYKGDKNNCGECGNKCNDDQVCFSNEFCGCGTMNGIVHHECTFSVNSYNNESAITICMPSTYFSENHVMIPTEGDCSKCEENYVNLDGDLSNGCEVDLKTTMKHCGATGNDCKVQINNAFDISCHEGKCEFQGCSDTNFMDCNDDLTRDDPDGCETNILVSATHCGKCGNTCPEGAICQDGACCYQEYKDIQADTTQFQCCEGYQVYEYKPSFAFPFCWERARYACSATDMSELDGCWVKK